MTEEQKPFSEMATAFDPRPVEAVWAKAWVEAQVGKPRQPTPGEKAFSITIPPPNVTGVLHLGHALQHTIHDCLLRYNRMNGVPTLCVPGTDHAGIGTQIKVEQALQEEGLTRHDLGREEFEKRTWEWKDKYGGTIGQQMRSLGCTYDWSRERFTLDEGYVKAVLTVFKDWFERGLIYRGYRLVNWSVGAQTTVSDLEIDYKEVQGQLTHIRYPVEGSPNEFVVVATTRPETMLGDTAVAVHPEDARYTHLHGKNLVLPLQNRSIPLILDAYVAKEFGTGAVKITPAHDPNDYEMGNRHGLPMITVIGFDGNMTAEAGAYAGQSREAARKQVVKELTEQGLIEKVEPYLHSVGHCSRTSTVIEPLLSEQWFVAMKELARPVADCLRMGRVHYHPERFAGTSLEWLDNIRDWCISRQLWWGHRIPIYYGPQGEVRCSLEPITEPGWTQDEDVLDTWFSSALWPFAVLGWPDQLQTEWYPTSVLITGRDILHLWVSRMIATSLDFVQNERGHGEIPFHHVFVHPTVQDVFGLRMSKSLGTGIDPMDLIDTYGTDAARFGLLQLATSAQDVRFIDQAEAALGEEFVRKFMKENRGKPLPLSWDGKPTDRYPQIQAARNFANKIWNASRLVFRGEPTVWSGQVPPDLASRWIHSRLNATIAEVTRSLEAYEFEAGTAAIYSFVWGDFCDWYLEVSKPPMREGNRDYIAYMAWVLGQALHLLHPFMPFITEEIWARLPANQDGSLLALGTWPVGGERDVQTEGDFALVQEVIQRIRNLRAEAKLPPGQKLDVTVVALNEVTQGTLHQSAAFLTQLANLNAVSIVGPEAPRPDNSLSAQISGVEIFLPLAGLVDVEKEKARLTRLMEGAAADLEKVIAKLNNPNFAERAPAAVVEKEEARRAELTATLGKLKERLQAL